MPINLLELIQKIAHRRSVFHSEADFQHELAWEMHLANPSAELRLEYPVRSEKSEYLDIYLMLARQRIGIELKYKTKRTKMSLGDEYYDLKDHGAQDIGCYEFVKDISRIESMVLNGYIDEGYAVMLTNDEAYRNNSGRAGTNSLAFRVHHGRTLCGDLAWAERTGTGTNKGREAPLKLRNTYQLDWRLFSTIESPKRSFHLLIVHVDS